MTQRTTPSSDASALASWDTIPQESLASLMEPPKSVVGRPLFWVRKVLSHRSYNEWTWAYLFMIPSLAFFTLFTLYPVVRSILLSLNRVNAYYDAPRFIGLYNYGKILRDDIWWAALKNTALFTGATVPVLVALSLLLAVLIRPFGSKMQALFRGIFYLPGVTSVVVISLIWLWIYYPFKQGMANYLIGLFDIKPQLWLGDPSTALPAIIFMVWMTGQGAMVVLYGAALNNIPTSLYEAADLDCASGWSKFRNITWPLIKPTTLYVIVIGTIGSFQVFDIVYTMTSGGPGYSTRTLVFQIYQEGFRQYNFGYASAQAMILALIIVVVAVFQFRYLSTDVEY